MIKKLYYNPKDREEWLVLRTGLAEKGMIGGSDAATILHANEYKAAIELFYQAVGYTEWSRMSNEKMIWGTELENHIGEMYRYYDMETGSFVENYEAGRKVNEVRNVNAIILNDKFPNQFANIDKFLPDIDGIGEIKNMNGFTLDVYKEPSQHPLFVNCPVGVPVGYYCQLQDYMMVCEKDIGRFIFLRDGSQMIVIEIKTDEMLQEALFNASNDFAGRVAKGREIMANELDKNKQLQALMEIEPDITGQQCYNTFRTLQIQERELRDAELTMAGTQEQWEAGVRYMQVLEEEKDLTERKNEAGNFLKTEFLKHQVETMDFTDGDGNDNGKIGMKKRLSVKLKF